MIGSAPSRRTTPAAIFVVVLSSGPYIATVPTGYCGGVGGKAVKQSRRNSPRRTEADKVATVRRHVPVSVGGADQPRRVAERAATHYTAVLVIDAISVFLFFISPLAWASWATLVS